jgi:hypothetical protein
VYLPRGSYDYDILVLLMQRAPDFWEVSGLSQRLAEVHLVFRDEREGVVEDRAERIRGQWHTLVSNLRKRLILTGCAEAIRTAGGLIGLKGIKTGCLVLSADSRYLKIS